MEPRMRAQGKNLRDAAHLPPQAFQGKLRVLLKLSCQTIIQSSAFSKQEIWCSKDNLTSCLKMVVVGCVWGGETKQAQSKYT